MFGYFISGMLAYFSRVQEILGYFRQDRQQLNFFSSRVIISTSINEVIGFYTGSSNLKKSIFNRVQGKHAGSSGSVKIFSLFIGDIQKPIPWSGQEQHTPFFNN